MAIHEASAVLKPAFMFTKPEEPPPPLIEVKPCRHGPMMYFPRDHYIGGALRNYGEYSQLELEIHLAYIKEGDVVVEAGANIGSFTVPYAKRVGLAGRVVAFEPQRVIYQMLCGNLSLNGIWNTHAFQGGLGAERALLHVPPVNYTVVGNYGGVSLTQEPGEPVFIEQLDAYQLPRCDFMKIDVEGMELEVLKGADATIKAHRPVLYVENDRKEKSDALMAHLRSLGYDLYWSCPQLYNPANFRENGENVYPDVVSINLLCLPAEKNIDRHPDTEPVE